MPPKKDWQDIRPKAMRLWTVSFVAMCLPMFSIFYMIVTICICHEKNNSSYDNMRMSMETQSHPSGGHHVISLLLPRLRHTKAGDTSQWQSALQTLACGKQSTLLFLLCCCTTPTRTSFLTLCVGVCSSRRASLATHSGRSQGRSQL